jgi:exodeoxyribonuclease V alpha subunit
MKRRTPTPTGQLELFPTEPNVPAEPRCTEPPQAEVAYDLGALFDRLRQSTFRSRFHLKACDREYISEKGMKTIQQHACDFIARRLAPAVIPNDGKQTPMRGHPVFLAQHATGCCCRGCLYKWHHIPANRPLTTEEQRYVVAVLMAWIKREMTPTE